MRHIEGKVEMVLADYNALMEEHIELQNENARLKEWFERLEDLSRRAIVAETDGARFYNILKVPTKELMNFLGLSREDAQELYEEMEGGKKDESNDNNRGYQE